LIEKKINSPNGNDIVDIQSLMAKMPPYRVENTDIEIFI
jgi:hypothetical protein